ncbi:MAG TPA: protein-glutamate O-methyltransferase CheR [Polyangiaceae bacterium]|nr:protein-glutamate O-methyltransferase CheR [Polyangiaceae bacterium]
MSPPLSNRELESFHSAVTERLGLRFDDSRLSLLAEVLLRRLEARRMGCAPYLADLASDHDSAVELRALARELTVGETYFFRHGDQFQALREVALPERQAARAASRHLRLLSAGCASGEEAYSLAILVREMGIEPAFRVGIQGVDLNPEALEKAARGVYSPWALRETPPELRQRWFQGEGREYRLAPAVREAVRFEEHNLIDPSTSVVGGGSFDIIFCRNVLMYFAHEHAAAVVAQLAAALAPGGFLFLGHAETLRGLSHAFHLRHIHDAFYYQLKGERELAAAPAPFEPPTLAPGYVAAASQVPAPSNWMGSWLETVERSSERIKSLSAGSTRPRAQVSSQEIALPARDLSEPLALLRSERFAEALQVISEADAVADPAALLLRAALLTQQGATEQAERTCHDLIRLDDLNAGAHYLLALCLERRGESAAAIEHDRTAVYLDAGFAMPHLHLGLMARRRREADAARHELGQALLLLEREDESRLLLFGGGFSRSALLALCRSELSSLGGAP